MRCLDHTFNIIANSIIHGGKPREAVLDSITVAEAVEYGSDDDIALEEEEEGDDTQVPPSITQEQAEFREWRDEGPIGMLRASVRYIRRSPQRSERFRELARKEACPPTLILCQDTRWNSYREMIKRAIECRAAIEAFYTDNNNLPRKQRLADCQRLRSEEWSGQ